MSAPWASSPIARGANSIWPKTFLVRETMSSFSRIRCDLLVDYHRGVWYQGFAGLQAFFPFPEEAAKPLGRVTLLWPIADVPQGRGSARERKMMLQTIHDESSAVRASSLCCVWIPLQQESGAPLIALRTDDQMRAFEQNAIAEFSAINHREVWNGQVR